MEKAIKKYSVYFVLFFLFCLSFSTSSDFSQDLGRHLKLGEIIWQTRTIPSINLFSYTHTAFPFINHHWLAEVFYFLLKSTAGLFALQILKLGLIFFAGWISIKSGLAKSSSLIVFFVSLFLFPLLLDRLDIRPELFGFLFFSLLLYILFFQKQKKLYYLVPFILLLWVNIHITFIFGIGLVLLRRKKLLLLSLLVLLLNPHGLTGILYPLNIWKNYGYTIAENQNLFFLKSVMLNPLIQYFLLSIPFIFVALFILFARKKYTFFILLLAFFVLPFWQIRHMPFFVFVAIPTVSYAYSLVLFSSMIESRIEQSRNIFYVVFILFCLLFSSAFIFNTYYQVFDKNKSFGTGFDEPQKKATDFVLSSKMRGNIFNNFDIGGYAIYRLFPTYKVFVDNRPEAYPAEFFQKVYIPLQEQKELREKIFKQYNIHTVFFSHTDMTPWGRTFLDQILKEPQWKMVYLDDSIVILTDEESFPDIRSNDAYMMQLVSSQDNYLSLLRLISVLSGLGRGDLSRQAFIKAQKINPSSCTIQWASYEIDPTNKSWVCSSFFSF
ncbi:hypothetical protein HZC27_02000 [Candidatus Roizmanbacteria bacterium]|nr:hypothetical protein [Candidatus Roizmanbacteria bacterium]